jgi:hypothetical protein
MPWRPLPVEWKVQKKRYTPGWSSTTVATWSAPTRSGVRQLPSAATALWGVLPLLGNRTRVPTGTRVTSRAKKLSYIDTFTVPRGSSPPEQPPTTAPASASTSSSRPRRLPAMGASSGFRARRAYLPVPPPPPASGRLAQNRAWPPAPSGTSSWAATSRPARAIQSR